MEKADSDSQLMTCPLLWGLGSLQFRVARRWRGFTRILIKQDEGLAVGGAGSGRGRARRRTRTRGRAAIRARDLAGQVNDAESQDGMLGRITLQQRTVWMLTSFLESSWG